MAETVRYSHYAFIVPFRDVSLRGEMHSAAYITYAEEALARFWSARATEETDPTFYVSKVACVIHKALRFGDDVSTAVRVSKIGGKSAGFAILLFRSDALVAEAEIVWTACDPDTGEALALPETLRDWLYQYLE
ncbi:acyl-CoA thioesterase [Rhizobium sp. SGZ-381]|uniref:acyl-CoA thioesterase n=1 Tax=Rhizobium sp. SGZ-381 TaxID=3342800 RepID=UPI00366DAAFE